MERRSMRAIARELGVSASYLSQVKNGKRPTSDRIAKALGSISVKQSVKQNSTQNGRINTDITHGGVLELADRQDLGSCAERREGSSPSFPTTLPSLLCQPNSKYQ